MLRRIPHNLALVLSAITTLMVLAQTPSSVASSGVTQSKQESLARAYRVERNGWIYVHLEGSPEEVGYQHGYLLAPEIDESLRVFKKYLESNRINRATRMRHVGKGLGERTPAPVTRGDLRSSAVTHCFAFFAVLCVFAL